MTFVPSGKVAEFPSCTQALDYELQLAFVIGKPLQDAAPADAERAITAFVNLTHDHSVQVKPDHLPRGEDLS